MRTIWAEKFNRASVPEPSKVMLPTYPVLCAVVGLTYLATPRAELVRIPTYEVADGIIVMPVWGALFLGLAVMQLVVLVATHRTFAYQLSLAITGVAMVVWALVGLGSWVFGDASSAAWVWPAFVAQACRASIRSLRTGGA